MQGNPPEDIPSFQQDSSTKRCPSCQGLSLRYVEKAGKFICEDCGFELTIPRV